MKGPNWIEKLKMASTKHISKKYHSKADRKYLKKRKEMKDTGIYAESQRQLSELSDTDYKDVMKQFRRK